MQKIALKWQSRKKNFFFLFIKLIFFFFILIQRWWKTKQYFIGRLTRKTRKIKIVNMLTVHEEIIEVSRNKINHLNDFCPGAFRRNHQ